MGKSSKSTNTTSSAPPSWAVPIIKGGANAIMDNYTANQPNLQALQGQITGMLPGLAQKAGDTSMLNPGTGYIGSTLASNPGNANPANQYLSGSLGSDFLNANPANSQLSSYANGDYLNANNAAIQQLSQFAGQQAGNAVNSTFSMAGRTGSGNHATDLARGVTQASLAPLLQNNQFEQGLQQNALGQLGQNYNTSVGQQQNAANMLGSNYNTGLGVQANAAGMLPSYNASQFSGYTPLLAGTQLAGQLPYYGSNSLGNIGSLLGNFGTTTSTSTQPSGGFLGGLLGAASNMFSFAPISLSDRRLKTNIVKLREAKDGLGEYEWNWKADPSGKKVRGVIADEVEKLRPWAFVKNFHGSYAGVNYAALGSMA